MRSFFVSPFLFAVAQAALPSDTTFSIGGPVTLTTSFIVGGTVSLPKATTSVATNTTSSTIGAARSTTSSSTSTSIITSGTTTPNSGVISNTRSSTKSTRITSLGTTSLSSGTVTVTVTYSGPPRTTSPSSGTVTVTVTGTRPPSTTSRSSGTASSLRSTASSATSAPTAATSTSYPVATAAPYDDRYWHPKVGSKFQIILDRNANRRGVEVKLTPSDAEIFDLDLFDTSVEVIQQIHDEGKKVICYFSAGGSESWRSDYNLLKAKDKGQRMKKWPNEQWLNIRSPDVWEIMRARIELAGTKGCDAIDADNTDVFNDDSGTGGGFTPPLSEADTIEFIKKLAAESHRNGVALGIKNAEDIFAGVINDIDFAVNEECATYGCSPYESLIRSGKPVFHIEYANFNVRGDDVELKSWYPKWVNVPSAQLPGLYCLRNNFTNSDGDYENIKPEIGKQVSTVIKTLDLTQFAMYCDGTWTAD